MYSNSMVSSCSVPAFRQQQQSHQSGRFLLPSIPHDLVQPLRDALPKIDKALLASVPAEAHPLCQQLFNAWLSNASTDITTRSPSRAKTTMDITTLHQSSSLLTKPCRKSQSTNRLSSWFSWTFPKRKNPSVAPMDTKMTINQNISDITSIVINASTLPPGSSSSSSPSPSPSSSSSSSSSLPSSASNSTSCISSRRRLDHSIGYRRSVSFMLSRLGTKVRRVIQSSSQRIHPQLKSSISTTYNNESNGLALKESFSSSDGKVSASGSISGKNTIPSSSQRTMTRQLLFDTQKDDPIKSDKRTDIDHQAKDKTLHLKTPWSPPGLSSTRQTLKTSKTDTNIQHELSVPFIKMGLGRKSLDVDDPVQYTTRSISSTSFALQWQEQFHDQLQPQERIASTLKSVSLTLYDIIQYNHAYQQFTSDTTYVAHPNLRPGEDAQELFATVPVTHWQDIYDQMAYIFENGVLTAEHAIITVIYIERMLENSKQHLCEANWRLIVLAGLLTSIKVWDDFAVHNMDFCQIFPELDIKHVNLIERRFLEHIDWDVSVRCSLFASTYFELRDHR